MREQNENTIQPRAVIYCRVSTKHQVDEGNSLATQERLCREYALKQGYEVIETFIERGESAKTKDRTDLQKLLAFCTNRKNSISYVVVYKLDRFSRNTDDYSYLRIALKRYGVSIKSTTEYFENTPAGRFMENIIANVSQFDNDVRTERAVNGSREAMREGRYVWIAPLGYSNTKVSGKANIAPNKMAAIVRQSFEEIAMNQYPIEEVRKRMFHAGLTNPKGMPVARSYFYRFLKNEVYAGWIVKFGERHKGIFSPIISDNLFEQVQLVLKHRTRKNYTYKVKHPDFPLRRFVTHPSGLKLTGSWNKGKYKKYPYYRFMGTSLNFRKEDLESEFLTFMDSFALKEEHFEALKEKLKDALPRGVKYRKQGREKIERQITELKIKQGQLIEKNLEGVISNVILREQLDQNEQLLIELNAQLFSDKKLESDYGELIDTAEKLLTTPGTVWLQANNENRLKIQVFEFPKGITYDGHNFQTPEICNLFKEKCNLSPRKSSSAGVKKKVIKFYPEVAKLPSNSGDKLSPSAQSNPNTKKYWEEIGEQLIEACEILKE